MTSRRMAFLTAALVCIASTLYAQQTKTKPFQAQSSSTVTSSNSPQGYPVIDIHNVWYELTGTGIPGRPLDEHLLLRKTVHSKSDVGDIGVDATFTLEAWRYGDDPKTKPLYQFTVPGTDGHIVDYVYVVSRGLEDEDWWSVYKLGNGQHLFDTHVPLLHFSISRETVKDRYIGLQNIGDDVKDSRLKQPNAIAVLSYASDDHVIREALMTSDDREQAALLRSFADTTRTLTQENGPRLRLTFTQNYPSAANPLSVLVPIANDDLDLAHAQLPPKLRIAAFKR